MDPNHHIPATSAEIAHLWTSYINDSLGKCVLTHFLATVEDPEVKPVLEYAYQLSVTHMERLAAIFKTENYPLPIGFTDVDVDPAAPRLFTDVYYAHYIKQMARVSLNSYSMAVALATRKDIREYYKECLQSANQLNEKATQVLLEKGLFVRPPHLTPPQEVSFIKGGFISGLFEEKRTLLAMELTHLYVNIIHNAMGKALLIGFSQVTKSSRIRKYFIDGRDLAGDFIEDLGSILQEEHLPTPTTWDTEVTDSTKAPFSEKLMMFHVLALNNIGMGDYGISLSVTGRMDVAVTYTRFMAEAGNYGREGAKLMISHGWMEQPPQTLDRDKLSKK